MLHGVAMGEPAGLSKNRYFATEHMEKVRRVPRRETGLGQVRRAALAKDVAKAAELPAVMGHENSKGIPGRAVISLGSMAIVLSRPGLPDHSG